MAAYWNDLEPIQEVSGQISNSTMSIGLNKNSRTVSAVHGRRQIEPDERFELDFSRHLSGSYSPAALLEQYARFGNGDGELDSLMRRAIWRALARKFGNGVRI